MLIIKAWLTGEGTELSSQSKLLKIYEKNMGYPLVVKKSGTDKSFKVR